MTRPRSWENKMIQNRITNNKRQQNRIKRSLLCYCVLWWFFLMGAIHFIIFLCKQLFGSEQICFSSVKFDTGESALKEPLFPSWMCKDSVRVRVCASWVYLTSLGWLVWAVALERSDKPPSRSTLWAEAHAVNMCSAVQHGFKEKAEDPRRGKIILSDYFSNSMYRDYNLFHANYCTLEIESVLRYQAQKCVYILLN